MRIVNTIGRPDSLILSIRKGNERTVTLQVDAPRWWALDVVTVLRTPDMRFVGTQFSSVAAVPLLIKLGAGRGGSARETSVYLRGKPYSGTAVVRVRYAIAVTFIVGNSH